MGRRPDPEGLQELKGHSSRKRKRAPLAVADGPVGTIKPLANLSAEAARVWRELGGELERMKFLRPSDRQAFGRYCSMIVRYWDVAGKLQAEGETYTSSSAHGDLKRLNPLFIIEQRLAAGLAALEDRFGMSPAARQTIMLRLAAVQPQLPLAPAATAPAATSADAAAAGTPPAAPKPIGILSALRH